jgi:hypothetical protein
MVAACTTGIFGALLTYWMGSRYFGFDSAESLRTIGAANVAGFFSGLLALALERRGKVGRLLMGNAFKAWFVLFILYSSILLALAPALREFWAFTVMFVPVVFSTGFMLPLWGPTQDRILRWEHRMKQRASSSSPSDDGNQQFSRL